MAALSDTNGFKQSDRKQDRQSFPLLPRQRNTLAKEISVSGRGVHSGIESTLTLRPAAVGHGIAFRRTDLPNQPIIPVSYEHLAAEELDRRTTLRLGDAAVFTIEHVLSALMAAQVDDAIIDLDAAEPPFLDGSALPFAQAVIRAGIAPSGSKNICVQPLVVTRPVEFAIRDSELSAIPYPGFRVTFFFTSGHPGLRSQVQSFEVTPDSYLTEIAPARTFCFFEEIEMLRKAGLIKGANLSSAVVIGRKSILNNNLRFDDEPVRHKILDFIGDMALLGAPLQGHFFVWRGGHSVNAAFGKHLLKELKT